MTDLNALCEHEAAHAVIAERYGVRVCEVRLDSDVSGLCIYDRRYKGGRMQQALIALAGTAAEQLWHGLPHSKATSPDFEGAVKLFEPRGCDMSILLEITREQVHKHRAAIKRVARALKRERRLTAKQLQPLLA